MKKFLFPMALVSLLALAACDDSTSSGTVSMHACQAQQSGATVVCVDYGSTLVTTDADCQQSASAYTTNGATITAVESCASGSVADCATPVDSSNITMHLYFYGQDNLASGTQTCQLIHLMDSLSTAQ